MADGLGSDTLANIIFSNICVCRTFSFSYHRPGQTVVSRYVFSFLFFTILPHFAWWNSSRLISKLSPGKSEDTGLLVQSNCLYLLPSNTAPLTGSPDMTPLMCHVHDLICLQWQVDELSFLKDILSMKKQRLNTLAKFTQQVAEPEFRVRCVRFQILHS